MAASRSMLSKSSRYSGVIFIVAVVQFVIVMLVAQAAYPCIAITAVKGMPGGIFCYNPLTNPISDLGNTSTSPLWPLFNYSIMLLGALLLAGVFLVSGAFGRGRIGLAGLALLAVSALGSAGVGVVPENTILAVHSAFALVAFLAGGLGIVLLGISMLFDSRWRRFSMYSILSGLITVSVLVFFVSHGSWAMSGSGLGFGAIERIVVAPILIWLFVVGTRLVRR